VVGQAASGREAVELARTVPMDVLLLDVEMPGQNGVDAITHIRARDNAPAILILSGHPASSYGVATITRGAAGYLSKGCDPKEIVKAITVVASGRKYLDEEVSSLLADTVSTRDGRPHCKLTTREFQVFLRLAQGQTGPQAARDLSLTPETLGCYRVKIMDKMEMRTNSELTYYAIKHKLIA